MKTALSEFVLRKKGVYGLLHVGILILSLILVVFISVDTFEGIPFYTQSSYMEVQFWVCVLFLADFFYEGYLAKDKCRYLATHFVFLLVSIPYLNIFAWMGWTFSPEVNYLLRFIPLIRGGYAMAIVVGWMTYNRTSGLFVSYLTILLSMIYFSSLAFYIMEHGSNALVQNYGSALWWAFMDATTVGSNIVATTVTGKVLSVLLASLGMMMFPIFTVYVTNIMERRNKEREAYYKKQNVRRREASPL